MDTPERLSKNEATSLVRPEALKAKLTHFRVLLRDNVDQLLGTTRKYNKENNAHHHHHHHNGISHVYITSQFIKNLDVCNPVITI